MRLDKSSCNSSLEGKIAFPFAPAYATTSSAYLLSSIFSSSQQAVNVSNVLLLPIPFNTFDTVHTIVDESKPPDKQLPTGTSLLRRIFTESKNKFLKCS